MGETNLVRTLQNPGGSGKDAYVLIPSVVSNSAMGTSTSSIHPTTQPKPTPSAGQNVKSQTIAMDEISKGTFARTQDDCSHCTNLLTSRSPCHRPRAARRACARKLPMRPSLTAAPPPATTRSIASGRDCPELAVPAPPLAAPAPSCAWSRRVRLRPRSPLQPRLLPRLPCAGRAIPAPGHARPQPCLAAEATREHKI